MCHGLIPGLRVLAGLLFGLVAAVAPAAPTPLSERNEIEARGGEFVAAINAPDDETRRVILQRICEKAFVERVTIEKLVAHTASLQSRIGPLEFHHAELAESVRGGSPSRVLHVYARNTRLGRWQDLQIRVSPESPGMLREIVFVAEVSEPVYLPNGDLSDTGTRDWFNRYIDRLQDSESLSGAVLLAVGDDIVFERYFGFADVGKKSPIKPDIRFNLGSGNKMFTALAVMLLEQDGKLRLSDTIDSFFGEFPDKQAARKISIGQLISHTSGIAEYWTAATAGAVQASRSASDLLPLVYKAGMRSEPGKEYSYSNSNFVLAGLIVEKIAKKPYDEFVRERITHPLGMNDTDTFAMDGSVPRLAERLKRDGQNWAASRGAGRGGPAGGGFSTPRDMMTFARALVQAKIVSAETLKRMTTSQSPPQSRNEGDDYGLGFQLGRIGQHPWYGHGGIAPGVNFEFRYYPDLDATLITFSNQDNGAYDDLRRAAEKMLTGVR